MPRYCFMSDDYDRTVEWLKRNNPYCARMETEDEREEFASNVVNACIRGVISEEGNAHYGTGMCCAVRISSNSKLPDYKRVFLYVQPPK